MSDQQFQFDLYRLNKVIGERTLFDQVPKQIERDADILEILERATSPEFKSFVTFNTRDFRWDLRQFALVQKQPDQVVKLTLACSMLRTEGDVVTDAGIETSISEANPPVAETVALFVLLRRHFLVIEHVTLTSKSTRWRHALEDICKQAAADLGYAGTIEFEPVGQKEEIVSAFRSFDRLTRLRVTLRLPNPDFSRYAAQLFNQMKNGGLQEYTQDMKNPEGLNKSNGELPHASIEIAESGYKRGDVILEGVVGKKKAVKRFGKKAVRGTLEVLRNVVRGMGTTTNTKEGKKIIETMLSEIERLNPPEVDDAQ